jgi:hypothetical protein
MTAADVMDRAASLLNDTAKTEFTYTAQIPYLNAAMDELQETFEQNNIAATNKVSAVLAIVAGVVTVDLSTTPALPSDLIEIQQLSERPTGTTNDFVPMTRTEFLPLTSVLTNQLIYWAWIEEKIKFIGANADVDVKIEYIKSLFTAITTSTTAITLINSKSFLAYRTAGLCAEFIGENPTRAGELNAFASLALDRTLGINVKGGQGIGARRRPFNASYRARSSMF